MLRENELPGVPVVNDGGRCVGIVTETDLVLPDDDGDLHLPHYVNIFGGTVFLEPLQALRGQAAQGLRLDGGGHDDREPDHGRQPGHHRSTRPPGSSTRPATTGCRSSSTAGWWAWSRASTCSAGSSPRSDAMPERALRAHLATAAIEAQLRAPALGLERGARAVRGGEGRRLRARGAPSGARGAAGGADWLAVATAGEAAELRGGRHRRADPRDGRARPTRPTALGDADVAVWDAGVPARDRARAGPRVHVKLDTGMGRLGTKDVGRGARDRRRGRRRRAASSWPA